MSREIDVEDWNWDAVQVFMSCEPTKVFAPGGIQGGGKLLQLGIPAPEIRAVCAAHRVRFDGFMLWAVRTMANVSATAHNAAAR